MIPQVAASERGGAQTGRLAFRGCGTSHEGVTKEHSRRRGLERPAIGGNSPVAERVLSPGRIPSTAGHVEPRGKQAGPSAKAKYSLATDSEPVP